MPNGIECELPVPEPQAPVRIGGGRLECDLGSVRPGPLWDPRPRPRFVVSARPRLPWRSIASLVGQGPGLTPLGDDVAAGYLGARALFGRAPVGRGRWAGVAAVPAAGTTSLSGTLLRLAADGQLPEAAHCVLVEGDPGPLLSWGATSGSGLLAGLGLYQAQVGSVVRRKVEVSLPLDPLRLVRLEVRELSDVSSLRPSRQPTGTQADRVESAPAGW